MLDLPSVIKERPIRFLRGGLFLTQLALFLMCVVIAGCGGGYAGGVVPSLASSKITIDSGQTFLDVATNPSNLPLTWSLSGAACSGQTCGTLSDGSALGATYVAPSVTQQMTVTLTSTVTGTQSTSTTTIIVNPAPQISGTAPDATVGTAYSTTFALSGGTPALKWLAVKGTLPAGLSFNTTTGILSGTPTAAGTSTFTLQAVDSSDVPFTVTSTITLKVNASSSNSALQAVGTTPDGTVNVSYVSVLQASGGTSPYTWSITSGTLPAGLNLSATGIISGTPTAAGTSTFTAQVKDAAGATATLNLTLKINAASTGGTLTIATSTLPSGTVQIAYAASITVTGGTAPYTCTVDSGSLPAGLTLGSNCAVTGIPTTAGTSTFTVHVTDAANPTNSGTGLITIVINPASAVLVLSSPPPATVGLPYSGAVSVTGGTAPYHCVLASGAMPAGLTLGSDCVINGTPLVAGTTSIGVTATDSTNPANITTATVTVTVQSPLITLTITAPPVAVVGVPYVGTILVAGGTAPYQCTLVSGTLPNGLTMGSDCVITGTPQTPGTSTVGITVTDSANPANTKTTTVNITVIGSLLTLTITAPPVAVVNVPYVGLVTVVGGIAPYTCTVASGTLPAGLTLNANCVITGTPTTPGASTVNITATDSANPANTKTSPVTITVQGALITLTLTAPPVGVVNVPYVGVILVLGGTPPYTCSVSSGTIPPGLTLHSDCTLSGTPTSAGTFSVNVAVHDSASPVNSTVAAVPITILGATSSLTLTGPANATVSTPYSGAIGVTGGTAPYTCALNSGSLPAGLTMAANCAITGTPTTAGTSTFNVTATDSASPAKTGTANIVMTVNPISPLTLTGGLPNATLGVAYTQTLQATGGLPPYTYTVTSGSLPAGLSLSSAGVVSGTPTAVGASSFTITATDSQTTPQQASLPLTMQVVYPSTPSDALLKGPYAFLFQGYDDVVAGVLAYQTATIGSITADGNGLLTAGELDSNHQSSNPTGNIIASNELLGTYTIGTDGRGTLAVTTINADGTAGNTTLYSLALKLPTAPATASSSGSMIESDGTVLLATKGSGTLLAQNANVYGNGLNGGYAYGVSGDTPCLPTCTIGLIAGPVASVGQFTANGGTITGVGDANVASTNYASSTLSGASSAADTNGRVGMTLTSSKLSGVAYPTHYAVYLVDQTHAFIMSTDKHSSYVLQAGTILSQSQTTFSNASLNGPFVGYENAPVNPGLVGKTVDAVLNLSSATIIRGTGNSNGTCTTTNVDVGGLTGLVNSLTGLGGGVNVLNAILGTYQSLGNSSCAVASNGRAVYNYPAPNNILSPILALLGLGTDPPPARVVYLTGNNEGYFLETGYAGLGHLEAQAAGPFTTATLNGTYIYGTVPASSLATIDGDGTFTADGAGNVTYTTDTNVGVGNLNILQLGVTGSSTYTVTDATAGRFLIDGTRVVYALSPGRFVILEGGALSTAPYTALLY
ncbi:beta strand repeat-containing protein [Terriglobus roseus]|uniref:Putative Ig domain-containing protein n=1 Tax=Terriglobus roseus TaxID=392734 RepID=A0A1G7PA39_9BACT|nr:putative Ig domain-containing protein [Terriglobus roseus]SDF83185.1 Putative Ig domain-containing protein [Terriglobus roseus]